MSRKGLFDQGEAGDHRRGRGIALEIFQQAGEAFEIDALFVAIEGEDGIGSDHFGDHRGDRTQTGEVRRMIAADLYLEAFDSVHRDVFFKGLRQSIVDPLVRPDFAHRQGIQHSDGMANRHRGRGGGKSRR